MYRRTRDPIPVVRDPKTGRLKYLSFAAEDLGVERTHLFRVLTGQRESKRLIDKVRQTHPELIDLFSYEIESEEQA